MGFRDKAGVGLPSVQEIASHCSCQASVEHVRQSRPDPGPGFQAKVLDTDASFFSCSEAVRVNNSGGVRTSKILWITSAPDEDTL